MFASGLDRRVDGEADDWVDDFFSRFGVTIDANVFFSSSYPSVL